MSEAADSRKEMERRIVQRSLEDDAFRQKLLKDPRAAIEEELGGPLPEEVRVVAVEETADTVFLVLPSTTEVERGGISDEDLEAVAGGGVPVSAGGTCKGGSTCDTCGQWGC